MVTYIYYPPGICIIQDYKITTAYFEAANSDIAL